MDGKQISQLLENLYRIHRQIGELNYRIRRSQKAFNAAIAQLETQKAKYESLVARKQELVLDSKRKERESEIAVQELKRRYGQLDAASSERQYSTLKMQIELEEQKNDRLANEALEAMAAIDNIELELKCQEEENQVGERDLVEMRRRSEEECANLNGEIKRAEDRLAVEVKNLPRDFSGLYYQLVKNFGGEDAFAPLSDGAYCGACDRQLPMEFVIKTRSGTATTCPSCGRLLYVPEGCVFE